MPSLGSRARDPVTREEYRRTLESLFRRRRFGLRPGLEAMHALLEAMGHPERAYPAVHITGSKGKGSVATFAESVLRAHGVRTGLFTSPHLASYRERIRIDGEPIAKTEVVEGIRRIEALSVELERSGRLDRPPTFFEATTALALDHFARAGVEAAVVEVGIGGRLDATNVIASRVGVITTVELEHTDVLGPTLGAIAGEKSGILRAGMTGIVGRLPPEADRVVADHAARVGVPLWRLGSEVRVEDRALTEAGQAFGVRLPGGTESGLSIPLLGSFQPENAALALGAVARFLAVDGRALDARSVRRGLEGVTWRGRLERVARRPEVFYDVAHTPESARAVAESLGEISPLADPEESAVVFGCLRGKDVEKILDALAPLARTLVVVPVRSERGLGVGEIRASAAGRFPRVVLARSAAEGLRLARSAAGPEGFVLVVGSDYLIGELVRSNEEHDEPDLSDPGAGAPSPPPVERLVRPRTPVRGGR